MSANIDLRTVRETLAYIHDDLAGERDLAEVREAVGSALAALAALDEPRMRPRYAISIILAPVAAVALVIGAHLVKSALGINLVEGPLIWHGFAGLVLNV